MQSLLGAFRTRERVMVFCLFFFGFFFFFFFFFRGFFFFERCSGLKMLTNRSLPQHADHGRLAGGHSRAGQAFVGVAK